MSKLSPRQNQILGAIRVLQDMDWGGSTSPNVTALARLFGVTNGTMNQHLSRLKKKGLLVKNNHRYYLTNKGAQ